MSTVLPTRALAAAPPAAAATAPSPQARQLEHARALYTQTPATLAGNLVGVVLVVSFFSGVAEPLRLYGWVAVMAVLWSTRLAHYLRFLRQPDADDATLLAWRQSWRVLALLLGSCWGLAAWMFWIPTSPPHQVALLLIIYSYCVGSVQMLAGQPRLFVAFLCLVLLPTVARVATDMGHPFRLQLALIMCILFGAVWLMARTYRSALAQAIELKLRTDQLAAQLRVEKAAAEDARRAAEAASRAKTQFFAAASHDLRQPLHAMGLFAETLRQRCHDPDVAALVNSINESVDALEGLFGELLDITRIDTGGVEVKPAPVRLREVFARLRLHFEPTAFEKGLALTFRGEQHVLHADPVVLERILRNLVSNAIRYTEDGGVLVSCRRRGNRLLLQVWDSGIGISEQSLPRIFDEFFQVHSSQRPLEPHQRKGLGLGLAIVKRLADLMGAPLTVRSRVGHGTVFSLEVDPGVVPAPTATPVEVSPKMPLGLSLQGRLVVVVEDEPAVREGLTVLLKAWGADVLDFDSVGTAEAWAASVAPPRPDLLIVDYRLPEARTGLEALDAIRRRWPSERLPAIVITGSSLSGHEKEADTHDFHLLIKPVLPNKLRAMIGFKLNQR
ncbi:ATP-binding protein [Azohydromonas aeria]|uniref:ATP-binding protein n=1 Tax=Azohydromonas aeria TaxID=2590212 RepID=UPI001E4D5917|nr:ATP-binding protein [Azohydromonas aeria]